MRYDTNKKTYYVDGQERTDVIPSTKEFCKRYLDEYEPKCLRWIQLPQEVAKQNNLDAAFGYHYTTDDNIRMVEYHEDTMSVRVAGTTRPLEIVGQDFSCNTYLDVATGLEAMVSAHCFQKRMETER